MAKPKYSDKIKNEPPDPHAFERFKEFTKKLLQVSKHDAEEIDKDNSRSTS